MHALKNNVEQLADADLIAASLDGDEGAFGCLIERHQDRVFRLLSRFTRGDHAETEDLAQEVFLKVFRKLHTFQQDSAFYTWVYRIAVNTATDHMGRRTRRRLQLVEDDGALDSASQRHRDKEVDDAGAASPLIEAEVHEVTRRVLEGLPEIYRTILILREYEDLSYTDMAEVLDLSIGTVESRLFRARKRFKDALERTFPEHVPQYRGGMRR